MFDHVTIHASGRAAAVLFYTSVLSAIGVDSTSDGESFTEWDDFSVAASDDESAVTRGLHICFAARTRALVDEFWRAGTAAGYRDDGAPGPRPEYGDDYYGGFLLDPDGNSAEAVHHETLPESGNIDHVWIRVADVQASKRFYEAIAPHAGLRLDDDTPERVQFRGGGRGSFSLIAGDHVTENVHMAFPAAGDAMVDAFHRAAIEAGYRDNGAPGERAEYHAGYYSAFVLDPDGNNVEVVDHHR
jgi:catechol 2,3-dioxygenase-like lactoylglutathione lyase family enzyme